MTTDSELNKKRLEVKNEINEGINKTPMALPFNITGRFVQKVTGYTKPLPFMFCVLLLAVIILLILGLNYLLLFRTAQATTQITPISAAIVVEIMLGIMAASHFNIKLVLSSIRDSVVDSIMSSEDLSKLYEWLSLGWSPSTIRRFFFWWILFVVGVITLVYVFFSQEGYFSVHLVIPTLLFAFLGGASIYYAALMLLLPARLRTYNFKLYENDPAHSEIVADISTMLNRFTYGYVFLIVIMQSSFVIGDLPLIAQIVFGITSGWVPVIAQYLVNQSCIRTIISRSKRKTLNRIQAEVKSLHEGDVKNKENLEAINRLMDYHERIRATPDSNLNMQSLGNFLNQLALPLFGFLIGNIDTIIDLFR
ncbi:MAG: hypothetical protein AABZ00_15990 [Chloroflexota bacterium]